MAIIKWLVWQKDLKAGGNLKVMNNFLRLADRRGMAPNYSFQSQLILSQFIMAVRKFTVSRQKPRKKSWQKRICGKVVIRSARGAVSQGNRSDGPQHGG